MTNSDFVTERFFVITKGRNGQNNRFVKNKKEMTNSIKYAKKFDKKLYAQDFILDNNLKNVKIAQATVKLSYVSYEGKDRPMTQKQKLLIDKLVKQKGELTGWGYDYPKDIVTVEEASNWIKETIDELEHIRFINECEAFGLLNQ